MQITELLDHFTEKVLYAFVRLLSRSAEMMIHT